MLDREVAKRIALVGLDVDGVLTDGGVYIGRGGDAPIELKRFDIQDNVGIRLVRSAGVKVVLVSGRVSGATTTRASELNVDDVVQDDGARKLPAFERILAREGLTFEQAAFVGDDLPDLPLLRRVGLAVAPANAVSDVRVVVDHVTTARGGHGAVREFCEMLLKARDEWMTQVEKYLAERGDWRSGVGNALASS